MAKEKSNAVGPVVSAAHLASGAMPALSELEYAVTVTANAMQRWMVLGTAASGVANGVAGEGAVLGPMDVQVLHSVHHRGREKSLSDLCMVLNIEDTHLVNYALKKLEGMGLIETGKRGKEKTASVTPAGREACEKYHAIREALLIESVQMLGMDAADVTRAAKLLRALSGQYEQAARSAASM